MKRMAVTGLSILASLAVPAAGVAAAAAPAKPVPGKIVKYVKGAAHTGTLTAKVKGKDLKLSVNAQTICGYQKGESGGPIACGSLSKYKGWKVNLQYTKHTATWISVVYPGPKK